MWVAACGAVVAAETCCYYYSGNRTLNWWRKKGPRRWKKLLGGRRTARKGRLRRCRLPVGRRGSCAVSGVGGGRCVMRSGRMKATHCADSRCHYCALEDDLTGTIEKGGGGEILLVEVALTYCHRAT